MNIECCNEEIDQYLRSAFLRSHDDLGPEVSYLVSSKKVDLDADPNVVETRVALARREIEEQRQEKQERERVEARERARQRAALEDEISNARKRKEYYLVNGNRPGGDSVGCAETANLSAVLEQEDRNEIAVDRTLESDVQRLGCFIVRRGTEYLVLEGQGPYYRVASQYQTTFWMPSVDLRKR